jgi:hypothetical protein
MSLIDDRGRVAGRINLVDAVVAIVVLVLIPVAYAGYLLFQTPTPKLTSIDPVSFYQGPNLRVGINGVNLRPFMRISFNNVQGRTFMIGSTTRAEVDLPDLNAGVYDVVLYDYMREIDRLPKALTILPASSTAVIEMEVAGSFKQLTEKEAGALKVGTKFPPTGGPVAEIVSVGSSAPGQMRLRAGDVTLGFPTTQIELPATLKVRCGVSANTDGTVKCQMSGPVQIATVAPDSVLTLAGPTGWLTFQIDEVHLATTPTVVQARARLLVTPEILASMKTGDVDSSPNARAEGYGAKIAAIGADRPASAGETASRGPLGGSRVVEVTLRVPIEQIVDGWTYKGQPFKTGAPFSFETAHYIVHGEISDAMLPAQKTSTSK